MSMPPSARTSARRARRCRRGDTPGIRRDPRWRSIGGPGLGRQAPPSPPSAGGARARATSPGRGRRTAGASAPSGGGRASCRCVRGRRAPPRRTGAAFEVAMDVASVPGDVAMLRTHGWAIADPRAVSTDPFRYRDYLRGSRGEFTVAKDMNIRLRSGWFSDRAACYLASGRPAIEQDTGFGEVLPLGPGLHAFNTVAEATEAVHMIERDYDRASAHASEVAREYFAADRVLGSMLSLIG